MGLTGLVQSPVGAEVTINGRHYVNFGGSSYLGLAGQQQIVEAGVAALRQSGCGYQYPRHHGVATPAHLDAERAAAQFFGTEAALYLAGGYYFGLIGVAALRDRCNTIFFDEWAHFSLREAICASQLPAQPYRHLDPEHLAEQLRLWVQPGQRPLVITDGMYSTFGEIAPLHALERATRPYDGLLLVDESHSLGVLGDFGRGACEHHGIAQDSVLMGGSTGKALGVLGGIIPSTHERVGACRRTNAGLGAAAGLPAAAAMCARSLAHVRENPQIRARLRENVAYLKGGLRSLGLNIPDTVAPVASFGQQGIRPLEAVRERLLASGIFVFHSTYIGAGSGGVIRCGIFADHRREHLDRLIDALRREL